MELFECGYGYILGNVFCCVLLLLMVGYVLIEVMIVGVVYEYLMLDGVQEDVVNLLLNLKGVVFKLYNCDEVMVMLCKEGEGVVMVGDIELVYDCEVINLNYVIVYLLKGGKFDVQIKIEKGCGYVFGNVCCYGEDMVKIIGCIVFDVLFLLVCCVSYVVESVCVEQCIDFDKFVMNIEMSGVIMLEEVICQLVCILVDQLFVFVVLEGMEMVVEVLLCVLQIDLILLCLVDDFELMVCLVNCLKVENIYYIGDLIQCMENELLKMLNFGCKLFNEIKEVFVLCGFMLGMKFENWLLVGFDK